MKAPSASSNFQPMPVVSVPVKVPSAGDPAVEGSIQITRWHVKSRQKVAHGDLLVTLETKKIICELEAETSGELEILAAEGKIVSVGETIAILHAA